MKNLIDPICLRCQSNYAEYKCEDCPILFNTLCSQCDTAVHSIIPRKLMHKKIRIGCRKKHLSDINDNLFKNDSLSNNFSFNNDLNLNNEKIDGLRNQNNIFKNDFSKLLNENQNLKIEK